MVAYCFQGFPASKIVPFHPKFTLRIRAGMSFSEGIIRMGLEPKTSQNRSGGVGRILRVSSFRDSQVINHHLHPSFLPETHHIPNYTGWFMTRSRLVASQYFGCGPLTVTVTTRIITFLVGDPYKPSFTTVTVRGPYPMYTLHIILAV